MFTINYFLCHVTVINFEFLYFSPHIPLNLVNALSNSVQDVNKCCFFRAVRLHWEKMTKMKRTPSENDDNRKRPVSEIQL